MDASFEERSRDYWKGCLSDEEAKALQPGEIVRLRRNRQRLKVRRVEHMGGAFTDHVIPRGYCVMACPLEGNTVSGHPLAYYPYELEKNT